MAHTILKESHIPYNIAPYQTPQRGEAMILEKDGEPIAAVVSITDFIAFQQWLAKAESRPQRQLEIAAIEREEAAFQQMLPDMQQKYAGHVVAIYEGQVIAVGDEEMAVWEQARQLTSGAPVYVRAIDAAPWTYKMPSRKVVRNVAL